MCCAEARTGWEDDGTVGIAQDLSGTRHSAAQQRRLRVQAAGIPNQIAFALEHQASRNPMIAQPGVPFCRSQAQSRAAKNNTRSTGADRWDPGDHPLGARWGFRRSEALGWTCPLW